MEKLQHHFERALTLRHLRALVAVADCGSLTRAAQSLSLTQSALSKALNEAEQVVGQALFERRGRQFTLSPHGAALLKHARIVLSQLSSAEQELEAIGNGEPPLLRIGSLSAAVPWLVPHCVALFKKQHPKTLLSLHEGRLVELLPRLAEGALDLVVGRLVPLAERQESILERTLLYEDRLVMVARPDHPVFSRDADIDLSRLAWILPGPGSPFRTRVEEAFENLGMRLPENRIESDSLLFDLEVASEGEVVFFMTEGAARRWMQFRPLRIVPVRVPVETGAIGILKRKSASLSPGVAEFIALLKSTAARMDSSEAAEKTSRPR